ncbi:MAG: hypothetical protein GXC72_07080 [Chitinophagaceae bacterium]|jgi:hypothetical protein|nr:hypothetical protein [Chitinophagaceae bacterium]
MDFSFEQYLPADFHNSSRVWIYQASRLFTMGEALQLEPRLQDFAANWLSHGAPVKGYANLLFGQFVVCMADETATGVSGCSTDSSVRVIKQIEQDFGVAMFDRQQLAFVVKDKIQLLPLSQFQYAYNNGFITPETLYFNNTVATKADMLQNWIIPVKQSWLAAKIPVQNS